MNRFLNYNHSCFSSRFLFFTCSLKTRFFSSKSTSNPWEDWYSKTSSSDPIHSLIKNRGFINGEWVNGINSNEKFEVKDPATKHIITTVPDMNKEDVKNAINIGSSAMKLWQTKYNIHERCDITNKIYTLLNNNSNNLSRIMSIESGKPLSESLKEITYTANFFRWFSEEGRRLYGDIIPNNINTRRIMVIKQPIGVCGILTPWNFPAAMIARKLAPALVTGCSTIIKPAFETPLTALAIAKISQDAGVPNGVINVITTKNYVQDVGLEISTNKIVRKVSFTGSTKIGILLAQQSATTLKKLSLELGGNAPFIVFDDADVDKAVEGAIASKYRNAGQTCVCTNRFYIQEKIYDEFVSKFAKKTKLLKIGHGFNNNTDIGPLINDNALKKVESFVKDAINKGGEIICGGNIINNLKGCENGNFYETTIICNVSLNSKCNEEEIFGPISPIFKFKNEDEILHLANNTDFGLASYFYTNDLNRMFRISENLEYGMVGVNSGLISTEIAPFGGIKFSGIGREGSKYGIDEYINIKYICIDNVQ